MLHQIWFDLGKGSSPPIQYRERMQRMCDMNPDLHYKLWDLSEATSLVQKTPLFQRIWTDFPHGINRADFFRYVLMYHYGGCYFDLDFVCARPIKTLYDQCVLQSTVLLGEEWPWSLQDATVHNGAIICGPSGHPFWSVVFNCIYNRLLKLSTHTESQEHDMQTSVFKLTGTAMLRDAVKQYWEYGIADNACLLSHLQPKSKPTVIVAPFGLYCPLLTGDNTLIDCYSNQSLCKQKKRDWKLIPPDMASLLTNKSYMFLSFSLRLWQLDF